MPIVLKEKKGKEKKARLFGNEFSGLKIHPGEPTEYDGFWVEIPGLRGTQTQPSRGQYLGTKY